MKSFTRREALKGFLGLAGTAMLPGCARNPVTGQRQLMLMSQTQEIAFGQQGDTEIVASFGVYDDPMIQRWVTNVGNSIARITPRPTLPWKFTVLDSPVVNAFALPGGFVYVTRGILGYFNNEAQAAGVIGHEIGHVAARHSAEQYSRMQIANLSLGIGSVFVPEFAQYAQMASVGLAFLFLKFSRDDETQADELGVDYASALGFDTIALSAFFNTLDRLQPEGGSLPEWASTHPDPGHRVQKVAELTRSFQMQHSGNYFINRDQYLGRINGIVFGDNPQEGYIKDGVFYHPQLQFQFPIPGGWDVSNTATEVRMSSKDGAGLIVFSLGPEKTKPDQAAQEFIKANSITVSDTRQVQVNGMPATTFTGTFNGNSQELAIKSTFIGKGNNVFEFNGVTTPDDFNAYEQTFTEVPGRFDQLTDKSKIDVKPQRLSIATVPSRMTLAEAFDSFKVSEDKYDSMAIVNGMQLKDTVQANYNIKILST